MKIYSSRQRNDRTSLTILKRFCGQDVWIQVHLTHNLIPHDRIYYHKINQINGDHILFNEVPDITNPRLIDRRYLTDEYVISYSQYICRFTITDPIQMYTTDEIIEIAGLDPLDLQ